MKIIVVLIFRYLKMVFRARVFIARAPPHTGGRHYCLILDVVRAGSRECCLAQLSLFRTPSSFRNQAVPLRRA